MVKYRSMLINFFRIICNLLQNGAGHFVFDDVTRTGIGIDSWVYSLDKWVREIVEH